MALHTSPEPIVTYTEGSTEPIERIPQMPIGGGGLALTIGRFEPKYGIDFPTGYANITRNEATRETFRRLRHFTTRCRPMDHLSVHIQYRAIATFSSKTNTPRNLLAHSSHAGYIFSKRRLPRSMARYYIFLISEQNDNLHLIKMTY
jgi:hypothetical protein